MEIQRTANAGCLLKMDGVSFLLDGLADRVEGYLPTPTEMAERLLKNPPDILVLFAFITAVLGSFLSYLFFISRRIGFDGKRLSFRKNFLTVKSFPIEAITSLEYNAELQLLIINRCGVFTCKFFDSGEIQQLQEAVARHINK